MKGHWNEALPLRSCWMDLVSCTKASLTRTTWKLRESKAIDWLNAQALTSHMLESKRSIELQSSD